MAISSVTNRVQYQGNGSSAVFNFPYEFHAQSDLAAFVYNSSATTPSIIAAQVLNSHYSISGTANASGIYPSGANLIFNSSPSLQAVVIIFRSSAVTSDFIQPQFGPVVSTAINNVLNKRTIVEQRLQEQVTRAMRLHDGYAPTFDPTLPTNIGILGSSTIMVNGAGTGFAMGPTADQIFSASSSAILAAASAASAATSSTLAGSAAVSASNQAVLAGSAALSASNSANLVGSTAFFAILAGSAALSASNSASSSAVSEGLSTVSAGLSAASAALASSSAVSAGNLVVLANSAAVSAGAQAVLAGSAALSASNSAAAANSIFPTPFTQYSVGYASSTSQMAFVPSAADGAILTAHGSSAPTFTLYTKPTITTFNTSAGVYTPPAGCTYLRVRMVGGGGGGQGSGGGVVNPASGANTNFSTLTAIAGSSGLSGGGGFATGGDLNFRGGPTTSGGGFPPAGGAGNYGGAGGMSMFGGAGNGGDNAPSAGKAAEPFSGSGGGAAGGNTAFQAGRGGGAGGYCEKIFTSIFNSTAYSVGTFGAGGTGSGAGQAGGAGAGGFIVIEEYYYR